VSIFIRKHPKQPNIDRKTNVTPEGAASIKFIISFTVIITSLLAACVTTRAAIFDSGEDVSSPHPAVVINVFAAASLTEAFNDIGHAFDRIHPGVTVLFNFAGSQQLAQQLTLGAPADVFASANQKQMEVVIGEGRVAPGSARSFVNNYLVVIVPKNNPASISSPADLATDNLRLVLAAPEVPAGQYALEFLIKASQEATYGDTYKDKVLSNVASYEDNVKAVLSKVALGEADAGIVYASDISADNAGRITRFEIPTELNVMATYPIARVIDSRQTELADAFMDYVLSQTGQNTLTSFGFLAVRR
jgi:molybdate transport system substrate-binding protein